MQLPPKKKELLLVRMESNQHHQKKTLVKKAVKKANKKNKVRMKLKKLSQRKLERDISICHSLSSITRREIQLRSIGSSRRSKMRFWASREKVWNATLSQQVFFTVTVKPSSTLTSRRPGCKIHSDFHTLVTATTSCQLFTLKIWLVWSKRYMKANQSANISSPLTITKSQLKRKSCLPFLTELVPD